MFWGRGITSDKFTPDIIVSTFYINIFESVSEVDIEHGNSDIEYQNPNYIKI